MALKIMVVDDEPSILRLLKRLVELMGLEVHAMADSREAARRLNKEKFDGVFVDAQMPNLDGFDLTRSIRNSPSNAGVPVVMLTGMDDVRTMRKGYQAGITFFLGKPITQERVTRIVKVMRGAMLRELRRHARLPINTLVTCQLKGSRFKSQSLNISEGGMLLETSAEANVGQEIDLEFMIPESTRPLSLRATVIRKQPAGRMAIRFLPMEPNDFAAIQGYISGTVAG